MPRAVVKPEPLTVSYYDLQNFGDQLNRLLVPKVLTGIAVAEPKPDPFRRGHGTAVYAVGSYLSQRFFEKFDESFKGVILGTGVGYPQRHRATSLRPGDPPAPNEPRVAMPRPSPLPLTTAGYSVRWVRGPVSARVLGLAPQVAIADAGFMVRQCELIELAHATVRSGVAVMPHVVAAQFADGLARVCEDLGFTYVDPRASLESILEAIAGAELLVTEALHGAVVADAFRTPWIPVKTNGEILEMKWRDFAESIGVDYRPLDVRIRWRKGPTWGPRASVRSLMRRLSGTLQGAQGSDRDTADDLLRASSVPPSLSTSGKLAEIDDRIQHELDRFRADWESGMLVPEPST